MDASASDRVVILDRDGTLVVDREYLADPDGLEFTHRAAEALKLLHTHAYRLVVISNQSGVGRGFFSLERLQAMNERLYAMVDALGVTLERIYCCPHHPDEGCMCRKPALGLLQQAADELRFDPRRAVVIGDKDSDIEFGRRAGARTILIADQPWPPAAGHAMPDLVSPDMFEAAQAVILRGW
jgi:D-glycero-D-manno-heptose 1,7-bisphosphate phosphatase